MTKKVTIEIEEMDEKTLYLNQHLGDGSLGDTKFDADIRLPDYSIVVKVGDKKYLASSQEIIRAVVESHEA